MEKYKWKVHSFKTHLNNSNTAELTLFTLSSLSQYWIETKHKTFQAQGRFWRKSQVPIFPVYNACLGKLWCLRKPRAGIKQSWELIKVTLISKQGLVPPRELPGCKCWGVPGTEDADPEHFSHSSSFLTCADTKLQAQLCIPSTPRAGAVPGQGMQERNEFLIGLADLVGWCRCCGAARAPMWDMACSLAQRFQSRALAGHWE